MFYFNHKYEFKANSSFVWKVDNFYSVSIYNVIRCKAFQNSNQSYSKICWILYNVISFYYKLRKFGDQQAAATNWLTALYLWSNNFTFHKNETRRTHFHKIKKSLSLSIIKNQISSRSSLLENGCLLWIYKSKVWSYHNRKIYSLFENAMSLIGWLCSITQ